MKIIEEFKAKRCVFSIECFPPKQTTQMEKLRATLHEMSRLKPDFISVTFGAGGSSGGVSTVEVADLIQNELGIPTLAHLICMGNDRTSAAKILDQLDRLAYMMFWHCGATARRLARKARILCMPVI